jgi:hypothetical protein
MAGRASISFCMTTRGPAERARALLDVVRPHVDEIVLAVDDRADPQIHAACAALADRRLTFEFVPPPCRLIGWLQHQCTADWLLRFDDDEIPSQALLDALPELIAERRLTHYGLTRRWLHGDARTYLLAPPWQPDYQLRLVRNVPGLWRFTGAMHDGAIVLGERGLADLPIYHADLLLLDADARRRKAERYERLRPDHMSEGASVNAIYVPEDWDEIASAPVPGADAQLIARVLDAQPAPVPAPADGPRPPAAVRHATFFDVDRFNTSRTVSPGAYAARIEFVRPVTTIVRSIVREQEVLVHNLGDERWPPGDVGEPPIRLGYRWRRPGADGAVIAEGPRSLFTQTVAPGGRTLAKLRLDAPDEVGRYVLEVDVVHEDVRWFGSPARLDVAVEEAVAADAGDAAGSSRRAYLAQARRHGLSADDVLPDHKQWAASLEPQRTPLSDAAPWLTFAATRALDGALTPGLTACEYGSGGSTLFLLERVAALTTIDFDADWSRRVGAAIDPARRASWTRVLVEPEPDAASGSADPADPGAYVSAARSLHGVAFGAYAQAIDAHDDATLDIVLVAGRARPACVRHALAKVRPGGLLVLDHSERPWYGPALALAEASRWAREDHFGPGPYAERFWQTTILRRLT